MTPRIQKLNSIFVFGSKDIRLHNLIKQFRLSSNLFVHNSVEIASLLYNFSSFTFKSVNMFKYYLAYYLGYDDYLNLKLQKSKFNLLVYQGHHGDYVVNYADLILPTTSFFEKNSIYVNFIGQYKTTAKTVATLMNIRHDADVIKALGLFLSGKQIKINDNFYLLNKSELIADIISYLFIFRFRCMRLIIDLKSSLKGYYTDNAMVKNSKHLSLAANVFSGVVLNYNYKIC